MRKLMAGAILILGLVAYSFFAAWVGDRLIADLWWAQLAYYAVAGIAWVPAAILIVRWGQKYDV